MVAKILWHKGVTAAEVRYKVEHYTLISLTASLDSTVDGAT